MLRRRSMPRQAGLCDPQVNPDCTPDLDWPQDGRLRLLSFNIQVGISTAVSYTHLTLPTKA